MAKMIKYPAIAEFQPDTWNRICSNMHCLQLQNAITHIENSKKKKKEQVPHLQKTDQFFSIRH